MIRAARADEAPAISELAIRSKSHWGYPPDQMAVFRGELIVSESDVVRQHAHVFEQHECLLGFYTLVERADQDIELAHLFVDPEHLGGGIGRALFEHARAAASAMGHGRLVIQSDPNAEGFYRSMQARLEGFVESSIPGRRIPLFAIDL